MPVSTLVTISFTVPGPGTPTVNPEELDPNCMKLGWVTVAVTGDPPELDSRNVLLGIEEPLWTYPYSPMVQLVGSIAKGDAASTKVDVAEAVE